MKNDFYYKEEFYSYQKNPKFYVNIDIKDELYFQRITLKMAEAPRTPLRNLQPGGEEALRRTPGGLSMDIVLTPALRPPPPAK